MKTFFLLFKSNLTDRDEIECTELSGMFNTNLWKFVKIGSVVFELSLRRSQKLLDITSVP